MLKKPPNFRCAVCTREGAQKLTLNFLMPMQSEIFLRFAVGFRWKDQDASRARIFSWSASVYNLFHEKLCLIRNFDSHITTGLEQVSKSEKNLHIEMCRNKLGLSCAKLS